MHVSTGPSRSVPAYAFPFTEQTEHIQKRARLQPVGCDYMLTLDAGDSVAFQAFSSLRAFLLPNRIHTHLYFTILQCICRDYENR